MIVKDDDEYDYEVDKEEKRMLKLVVFMSSKGISKPHELLLFLFI